MIETFPQNKLTLWLGQAPWRILAIGVVTALALTIFIMWRIMQAPVSEITALVSTLGVTSVLSVGLGYLFYQKRWARSRSIMRTLILTYAWAALLTLFNVWIMSERMFVSEHDLALSGVLLLFAAIIATSFGVFVAASITDGLHQLAETSQAIAAGNFKARVAVTGQDEIAHLGKVFNSMAQQLEEAAKEREELDSLRRDLIAWTSHDLRTPLTSIRALIETLHDGVVDDKETIQRYYRTIRADVIALNTLIDDLFELAQLDAGGLRFEMSSHALSDIISDSIESFQALAEQRDIHLNGQVDTDVDPVTLNAAKISRVLGNQLSNALRYTPKGGEVMVTAQRTPEGVEVIVEDSGPGFNPNDLSRVFEKFYRGEQARSRSTGGAGLGLAIAKGIVEAHNGRIWAKNSTNGGAIVGFTLPTSHQ